MITPNDIGDRLEELIRQAFPGEDVHRELCPEGFARPCSLVTLDSCEGEADFSTGGVELRPTFTLTTFTEVDAYHHSDMTALHLRQMRLTGLLLPGYIRVGDRALKVAGLTLAGGYDYDTVTVTFRLTLSRKDFEKLEQTPLMEHLQVRKEVRSYE